MRILILFAILTVACARGGSSGTTPMKPGDSLEGKSLAEVLSVKYEKAVFTCGIWLIKGSDDFRSRAPNDTQSVPLAEITKLPYVVNLKASVGERELGVKVTIRDLEIRHVQYTSSEERASYAMKFSPVADITYAMSLKSREGRKLENFNGKRWVYESIKEAFYRDESLNLDNSIDYFNTVDCVIETRIRPEYQDQFKVEQH